MRHLKRLPAPQILVKKKEEWTRKFLASGKRRPESSKYAHNSIKEVLQTISLHKCFYCERSLKEITSEVDHYYEVSEVPEKAFEWENLYLACQECNDKFSNKDIPNSETLDPCYDTDEVIMQHLAYENELIIPINNSDKGRQTIRKYRLGREQLDHARRGHLIIFYRVLSEVQRNQVRDGGRAINEKELELLNRFQQSDQPFSLMFKILFSKHPLAEM